MRAVTTSNLSAKDLDVTGDGDQNACVLTSLGRGYRADPRGWDVEAALLLREAALLAQRADRERRRGLLEAATALEPAAAARTAATFRRGTARSALRASWIT